jgi:hypothetical protein
MGNFVATGGRKNACELTSFTDGIFRERKKWKNEFSLVGVAKGKGWKKLGRSHERRKKAKENGKISFEGNQLLIYFELDCNRVESRK